MPWHGGDITSSHGRASVPIRARTLATIASRWSQMSPQCTAADGNRRRSTSARSSNNSEQATTGTPAPYCTPMSPNPPPEKRDTEQRDTRIPVEYKRTSFASYFRRVHFGRGTPLPPSPPPLPPLSLLFFYPGPEEFYYGSLDCYRNVSSARSRIFVSRARPWPRVR